MPGTPHGAGGVFDIIVSADGVGVVLRLGERVCGKVRATVSIVARGFGRFLPGLFGMCCTAGDVCPMW